MAWTGREFIDNWAAAVSLDSLSDEDVEALLELAGTAAHASERIAAPLTCWLAAAAGLSPSEALDRVRALAEQAPS